MTENQVLADRVLIRPEKETKTAGGVFLADNSKERPMKGEIVLVGPGTKDVEMVVKPGDTVLFGKYSGQEVSLSGEEFLLMRQDDIFMITNIKQQ